MLISTNQKNVFNKFYQSGKISSFHQEPYEINSYPRIQSSIISNDLNKLEQELKSGYNPNSNNNSGETPLFLSLYLDNIDTFKILLKHNADCNIQRNDGNTVLHLAIVDNKLNFVNILLENKANPNLINKTNNQTPFHLAIINKLEESILLKLRENGANRYIKDKYNKKPFDYAIETKDNNYILLFNKIFEQKENIYLDDNKDKYNENHNKFNNLSKQSYKRNIIIKDNNENIDLSNFNGDANSNSNTLTELYSTRTYNITTKNKSSSIQDTIKEIKINELKDFSLNDLNFKNSKSDIKFGKENESPEKEYGRKCQTFVDCDSNDLMKKIILDTVKKLNNSQIIQKNSEKKFLTKNLFSENNLKNNEHYIYNYSGTFENTKKGNTLNFSGTNNIISGASSVLDEKDSNSNFINDKNSNQVSKKYNKATNNIIILKDDSSDYNSYFDSITGSIKYGQEKNYYIKKETQKCSPNCTNMKYMIMKQIKEKNKNNEIGSPIYISNKILSRLRNWLISCDLLSYYNLFYEKKFVNIDEIITKIKEKKLKLSYKFAEDIGIRKPGHIIRFLLKLQIDSEILDKNLCDIILEKYCNNNVNTFVLNSPSNKCKCCGMSCFTQEPAGSCDFNEFTNYINNNDIFAFLRSKNLFEFKDNFIHNGFDQVDYIIIQLFSEFKFNKNVLIELLHIYHEAEQKKVIKILYEEKEKICKEINVPFNKKEIENILSEFKGDEETLEEKEDECIIF